MKNQTILLVSALLIAAMSMTACSSGPKRCKGKGGGWYGNRNLTYQDVKNVKIDHLANKEIYSDNCEEVCP